MPELSRVAEWNGQIVGAIYSTRAWIVDGDTRREVVTFGPLAVEPMMEGNDIGGALVRETLGLAGSFGAAGIIIMGEPYYYPRFGFRRGAELGITDAWGNSPDALMVYPLNDDFYSIHGCRCNAAGITRAFSTRIDSADLALQRIISYDSDRRRCSAFNS